MRPAIENWDGIDEEGFNPPERKFYCDVETVAIVEAPSFLVSIRLSGSSIATRVNASVLSILTETELEAFQSA